MTDYPDSAFVGVLEGARDLPKTQIMVLASAHLETLETFSPRLLDTLLEKLETYKPDVIAVENLSPELVAMMEFEGGSYTDIVQRFAPRRLRLAPEAQTLVGLERRQAKAEAKRLAAKQEEDGLETAEAVRLILSLIASYDLNNAALAWQYLSAEERLNAADNLNGLAGELDGYLEHPNEVAQIALRLAAQLEHSHIHYFDDHRDAALFELYGERIEEIDNDAVRRYLDQIPALQESGRRLQAGLEAGDLWDFYRYVNTPEFMAALVDAEVGVYYDMKLPSGIDRMRAAQYETRNLYMAGNLRLASALYPGGRVLAVVGSSHKPLLDRHLAALTDVQLEHLGNL